MPIEMIATDVDGTYMPNLVDLVPKNVEAVKAAKEAGIRVVPCTGRHWGFARHALASTDFDDLCVTSNGAAVRDTRTGEGWEVKRLPQTCLWELHQFLMKWGEYVLFCTRECFARFSPERSGYRMVELDYAQKEAFPVERRYYRAWGDLMEECGDDVERIILSGVEASQEEMVQLEREIEAIWPLSVTSSLRRIYELMPKGSNKASGAQWVASHYGIPRERVLTIGDNLNDIPMIRWAGVGVAVGDGHEALRKEADLVTLPCTEGGLAKIIYDCIEGKIG